MLRNLVRQWLFLAFASLLNAGLAAAAVGDPPARVGRLAHVEEGAIFRADRNDPGSAAVPNWPVTSGNMLETRRPGRAEVWVGSTAYRLAEDSQSEFSVIDDQRVAIRLNGGSLTISILDRDQLDDLEIAIPGGRVRFQTPGRYRFDVFRDFNALTVQAGHASFDNGQQIMPVTAGQRFVSWADGRESLEAMLPEDNFDRWVAAQENASLASVTRRYVSPQMSGYQDLDAWGEWQMIPEYGMVWYPLSVSLDWAPYRYGRWAWIDPWGWTWIDAAPWGFAPFHYGRWAMLSGRWCWIPGQHAARPVYAPALVGWTSRPDRMGGFRAGGLPASGWFPLGPREVYVPTYRHSPRYVEQLNFSHVRDRATIEQTLRRPDARQFMYRQDAGAITNRSIERPHDHRMAPPAREFNREPRREFQPAPSRPQYAPQSEIRVEPRPDVERRREAGAAQGVPLSQSVAPSAPSAGQFRGQSAAQAAGPHNAPAPVQPTPQTMQAPVPQAALPHSAPPVPQPAALPLATPAPQPIVPPMARPVPPPPAAQPMYQPMAQPMPERRQEQRELRTMPPVMPASPPAAAPSAPQSFNPPPVQGNRDLREGARSNNSPANPSAGSFNAPRGDGRGRQDREEGRGPR